MILFKKNHSYIFLFLLFSPALLTENNQKLRVLFCVKSFPSYTSWFLLNQIVEFVRQGHEITILARDQQLTTSNNTHPDILQYNLLKKIYVNHLPDHLHSFDIILCQFSSLSSYVIHFMEKHQIKGKLFVFVRGAFCKRGNLHKEIRKKIFEKVDMFLPVCKFSKNQLITLGCDPKKIKIIHSTIDTSKFSYTSYKIPINTVHIVTTSRLSEQKGLEYAIKAMREVLKYYPNCNYTIIGDGNLRNKLEQLIINLGLKSKVFLLGWKKPEEIVEILKSSHIFIHPSVTTAKGGSEGIPTAIMEAMASGMPIIATTHAGIPELIKDGISGFLVPEKDSIALAEKIIFLVKNQTLWNEIGLAGRKTVEKNFDKKTENKKFVNFCIRYIFK